MSAIQSITNLLGLPGNNLRPALEQLSEEDQNRVATVLLRPDLNVRYNATSETLAITTSYGTINVDGSDFHHIKNVYVNGQQYSVLPQNMLDGVDALEHLTGSYGEVMLALDEPVGRRSMGRQVRQGRNQIPQDVKIEDVQKTAYEDLSRAGITYSNLFQELGGVMQGLPIGVGDIMTELSANSVPEDEIPHFLIYDSEYKKEIMSRMYMYTMPPETPEYHYELVTANDDTFVGRLVGALGHEEGQYDREKGVLTLQEASPGVLPTCRMWMSEACSTMGTSLTCPTTSAILRKGQGTVWNGFESSTRWSRP